MMKKKSSNYSQSEMQNIDHYMKLADFYISRFDNRREYEWKVTLGLWGAILGSIVVFGDKLKNIPILILSIIAVLVLFGHFLWLHFNWRANRIDKDSAFKASRKVAKLLDTKLPKWKPKKVLWMAPAMAFQLYITFVLLILVIVYAIFTN